MSSGNETHREEPSGDDFELTPSALESAQSHLAGSPGTSCPGCVGCQAFTFAFGALIEWAEAAGLISYRANFSILVRGPVTCGNEHEVWFDEDSNRWFKLTYANKFGLPWGRSEPTATALEYLTRLVLQNKYFLDDIQLVAVLADNSQMRILTSQPHIAGEAAPAEEIQAWFNELDFVRVESHGSIAWYRKKENLLVADAHEGNVIKTLTGDLVPIDLNIVQPMGIEDLGGISMQLLKARKGPATI